MISSLPGHDNLQGLGRLNCPQTSRRTAFKRPTIVVLVSLISTLWQMFNSDSVAAQSSYTLQRNQHAWETTHIVALIAEANTKLHSWQVTEAQLRQ